MLDDPTRFKEFDTGNMISYIESLPEQLIETKELTKNLESLAKPNSVMVLGVGGSGIVGDLLHDWLSSKIGIPIITSKNLNVPEIDKKTLLLAISYSGNTRETLMALNQGLDKTNNVLCIASGGELQEFVENEGLNFVEVPSGYPPRCALGYLFGSAVHALQKAGVYNGEDELNRTASHLKWLRDMLGPDRETAANPAKRVTLELESLTPAVYAYQEFLACAKRWQTQLNENSKVLAWYGALPEMTHNEVVGWDSDERAKDYALVFLRDEDEPELVKNRFQAIKERMKCKVLEVWSEGRDRLSRMLHLIYVGDFVSYYLAIQKGVDPMPVEVIDDLKRENL